MDLKKLSGAASGLGDKVSGMGGQDSGAMPGKLFPSTGRQTSKEEYAKMQECAEMLEKYVPCFPMAPGVVELDARDMARWKNDFFKTLVHGGPELQDDQFYTGKQDVESDLGIGTDGAFTCEELFHFLYRLFKAMAACKVQTGGAAALMQNAELFGCAEMLEKYIGHFPKNKGNVKLNAEDSSAWKERFFPNLVEGGPKLPDYAFFKPSDRNYGIGLDCTFSAKELFQFLYRLYKEIWNKLR